MIQPLPQECGVRRAFPAITGRGRGWCANGFNYHSDRNTGRQAPRVTVRTGSPPAHWCRALLRQPTEDRGATMGHT